MMTRRVRPLAPALIVASLAFPLAEARAEILSPEVIARAMATEARQPVRLEGLRSRDREMLFDLADGLRSRYPDLLDGAAITYDRRVDAGVVFYRMVIDNLASPVRAHLLCDALDMVACPVADESGRELGRGREAGVTYRAFPVRPPRPEDIARAPNPKAAEIEARVRAALDPLGALPQARPDVVADPGNAASERMSQQGGGRRHPGPAPRPVALASHPVPAERPMILVAHPAPQARPLERIAPRPVARMAALDAGGMRGNGGETARQQAQAVDRAFARAASRIRAEMGAQVLAELDADAARAEIARTIASRSGDFAPGTRAAPVGTPLARAGDGSMQAGEAAAVAALAGRIGAQGIQPGRAVDATPALVKVPGIGAIDPDQLRALSDGIAAAPLATAPLSGQVPEARDATQDAGRPVPLARPDTLAGAARETTPGPIARDMALADVAIPTAPPADFLTAGPNARDVALEALEAETEPRGVAALEAETEPRGVADITAGPKPRTRQLATLATPERIVPVMPRADRAPAVARLRAEAVLAAAPSVAAETAQTARITRVHFDDRLVQGAAIDFDGAIRTARLARMPSPRPDLRSAAASGSRGGLIPARIEMAPGVEIAQAPGLSEDDANAARDALLERLGARAREGVASDGESRDAEAPSGAMPGVDATPIPAPVEEPSGAAPDRPEMPRLEDMVRDTPDAPMPDAGEATPPQMQEPEPAPAEMQDPEAAPLAAPLTASSPAAQESGDTPKTAPAGDTARRAQIMSVLAEMNRLRQAEQANQADRQQDKVPAQAPSEPADVLHADPATGQPPEGVAAQSRARAAQDLARQQDGTRPAPFNADTLRIDLSYVDSRGEVAERAARIKDFFPAMILAKGRMYGAQESTIRGRWVVGIAAHDMADRADILWYLDRMEIPYRIRGDHGR